MHTDLISVALLAAVREPGAMMLLAATLFLSLGCAWAASNPALRNRWGVVGLTLFLAITAGGGASAYVTVRAGEHLAVAAAERFDRAVAGRHVTDPGSKAREAIDAKNALDRLTK